MNINEIISRTASNGEVTLPSGEFEGPLVINKPLRVRGKSTTIWAKKSPVIKIRSGGVTIEDIRAEITEGSIEEPAVISTAAAAVRNVEVLGRVSGFGAEDGYFDIPRTIALGGFPANEENTYRLEVNVPAKTEIVCEMREVKFEPTTLQPGRNELTIRVSGISAQTFLYAEVLFKSQFTRRVYITGRPDANAERAVLKPIYSAPQRDAVSATANAGQSSERNVEAAARVAAALIPSTPRRLSERAVEAAAQTIREVMHGTEDRSAAQSSAAPKTEEQNAATDFISMAGKQIAAPQNPNLPPLDMKRGQRVGLLQYLGEQFEVWFTANAARGVEIDPYVFLLESGDRAIGDEGLVFFGNARSKNGEAQYFPEDGHVAIDLSKVQPGIQKIALAYSIYDGGASKNFRLVSSPRVSLRTNGERVTFTMNGLGDEATIVALEFYLYKGEWKISAVGAGFRDGLAKLCNRYGIEVE